MAQQTAEEFTEEIAKWYAERLKKRFPEAKFLMNDNDAVEQAIRNPRLYRVIRDFEPWGMKFAIDNYLRTEGKIETNLLIESIGNALVDAVSQVVDPELAPEREDPIKKMDSGTLWIVHKPVPAATMGMAVAHFAAKESVGVFCQAGRENNQTIFWVRTAWAVARSGEIQKEPLEL